VIDHFDRAKFEAALPVHRTTGARLWSYSGLEDGEETYAITVPNPHANNLYITVRSSIHSGGTSAGTGEDSIRFWLMHDGQPMGSKLQKYVTRVPGWDKRLTAGLRELYRLAMMLTPCPKCGRLRLLFKVTKQSHNKGRMFMKCTASECIQDARPLFPPGYLVWLTPPDKKYQLAPD